MTTTASWRALAVSAFVFASFSLASSTLAHPGSVDDDGCHRKSDSGKRHCHPQRARTSAAKFDAAHPPRAGDEGVFHGPLVRVTDGDTLRAKVQGVVMDFRLAEIDAPEFAQPYGPNARLELLALVSDRYLVIVPKDTDRYGRTVAHIWVGAVDVSQELVKRGAAWFYDEYSSSAALYQLEQEARKAKRGLWALPVKDRVEPWVWRKEAR